MKARPCPWCGEPPTDMRINGMRIVCCIPCTKDVGGHGCPSVKDWNYQVDRLQNARGNAPEKKAGVK